MLRPIRFRPATHAEIALVIALKRVSMLPGVGAKRIVGDLHEAIQDEGLKITERQAHALQCIAWTYRRQLPAPLRPAREPEPWTNPAPVPLAEDPAAGADAPLLAAMAHDGGPDPAERSI